jgi:hypothetical protein
LRKGKEWLSSESGAPRARPWLSAAGTQIQFCSKTR